MCIRDSGAARTLESLSSAPQTEVWLLPGGDPEAQPERAPLEDVYPGDLVAVRAGERIAVDGVVERGESAVDQSRLTGEPSPADVCSGRDVWALSLIHISKPTRPY